MAESLFLNKKKIDLYSGRVTRKIRIGDVGNIDARQSSFSYTINIPRTSRNTAFFEMLAVPGNTSRKPFEEVVADYVIDGIYLVANGLAIIRETSNDFKVNIIDGVRSLAELLNGKKLVDLPLDDLNHVLSSANYIESLEHTEGFIYGIANYGLGVTTSVKVEKQAPSIFTHTLFRRIFEAAGLTLQGEFFTTNLKYLNEVVAPSRGYEVTETSLTEVSSGGVGSGTLSHYEYSNDFITIQEKYALTNLSLIGASISGGNILFSVAGTYVLDISVVFNLYQTEASVEFRLNDVVKSYISLIDNSPKAKKITFIVNAGDIVSFYLNARSEYRQDGEFNEEGRSYAVSYTTTLSATMKKVTGGQLIKPSDYIGDMNQLDFLKDVINRFGLLLHPVQNTNEFKFKRIEALLSDRENAEDWTKKVVSIDSENYVSGYSRTNKAVFKYPSETVVPTNDGAMLIDNENSTDEKTMFTSPFEIAIESSYFNGKKSRLVPIWKTEDAVIKNLETPLKLFNIERMNKTINAKLFDEVTGISASSVPFLSVEFITMNYYINNFYRSFQSLIDNYKEQSLTMNLSIIDIYNIDFFKLKYLKQTGRFYYLTGIQNTIGKPSKVDMIEIKDFPSNRPPTQVGNFTFNLNRLSTRSIPFKNLETGYEDPELDSPYKIKIISGFNSDVLLKQDSVTIASEIEVAVEELILTAVEVLGGVDDYVKRWLYAISDVGSKSYRDGILEAEEITENRYITSAGVFTSNPNMNTDKYSLVTGLNYYLVATYPSTGYGGLYVANYYDSDDNFISGEALVTSGVVDVDFDGILTPPTGAAYVLLNRATLGTAVLDDSYGVLKANVLEFINSQPVADAGDDFSHELTDPENFYPATAYLTLTGSRSKDTTGEIDSYLWEIVTKPGASNATLEGITNVNCSLKVVNDYGNPGTYTIRLTVTDEFGLSDTDEVEVELTNTSWILH